MKNKYNTEESKLNRLGVIPDNLMISDYFDLTTTPLKALITKYDKAITLIEVNLQSYSEATYKFVKRELVELTEETINMILLEISLAKSDRFEEAIEVRRMSRRIAYLKYRILINSKHTDKILKNISESLNAKTYAVLFYKSLVKESFFIYNNLIKIRKDFGLDLNNREDLNNDND